MTRPTPSATRTDTSHHPNISISNLRQTIRWLFTLSLATLWLLGCLPITTWATPQQNADTFTAASNVLLNRCIECHHAQSPSGGLDLSTRQTLHQGGDSGDAVDTQSPADSYLLERIDSAEMPPPVKGELQTLSAGERTALLEWLSADTPWPADTLLDPYAKTTEHRGGRDWWSFQPIRRPTPPATSAWSLNPIDAWIEQRLNTAQLSPSPDATRETLIRRLTFDLTGLPPTLAEIEAFVANDSPDAYESLVDRLLESPHYGERMAQQWLDLVRFAETSGYERDQEKPFAWRYRDWVVNAFNQDMPFDQFLTHQLAGDEIASPTEASLIATGFLRLGTWNDEPNDPNEYQYERLEDLVHATSSAFLGLTVKCARCHDHKFDPIPQVDYYRFATAFWAGPIAPRASQFLGGPTPEEFGHEQILGWTDLSREPRPLHRLKNGDPKRPLEVIEPGFLSAVPTLDQPLNPPAADAATTQRRRQLAQWMVAPQQPLTARVIVNRLWTHHFAEGLVRSLNNFGFTGDQPSHPELLDWLASELRQPTQRLAATDAQHPLPDQPWSLKRVHKLIVMSHAYRQAADHPNGESYVQVDSGNRMLWHFPRHRIPAEALRDRILAASGTLKLELGGESFRGSIDPEALEGLSRKDAAWQASPIEDQHRRSLYQYKKRSLLDPLLTVFDSPDTTLPCARRETSTVAPQALALLNGSLVHEHSRRLARQIADQHPDNRDAQIDLAWRRILARHPDADEIRLAKDHVARQIERFTSTPNTDPSKLPATTQVDPALVEQLREGLRLELTADKGLETDDEGRVVSWQDGSDQQHNARQSTAQMRPTLRDSDAGPAVHFSGESQSLNLQGDVLTDQPFTIAIVASDQGGSGHRELFSNWNGAAGNSGTSLFIGLTQTDTIRLTDDWPAAGHWPTTKQPTLILATNGPNGATVRINGRIVAQRESSLSPRRLDTDFVLGTQGNINGEFWHGDLYAIRVWDHPLDNKQLDAAQRMLADKFNIELQAEPVEPLPAPEILGLESLCLVLMNSNEFVYVD